ncbi:hypothetical protein GBA52_026117 [Prunus armeniaca]|nr:hypothetical protein GBA52_026117 [Prunus armeniaca]
MVGVDDNQLRKLKTPNPRDNQSLIGRASIEDEEAVDEDKDLALGSIQRQRGRWR